MQERWEIARWMAWQNALPNFERARRPRTPQAYWRFPWEQPSEDELREKAEQYRVSAEEAAELNRIFAEIENKENHEQDR